MSEQTKAEKLADQREQDGLNHFDRTFRHLVESDEDPRRKWFGYGFEAGGRTTDSLQAELDLAIDVIRKIANDNSPPWDSWDHKFYCREFLANFEKEG